MTIGLRARLPLAIAGLLLSAQTQAFLPTPLSVLESDALSPDASSLAPTSTAPTYSNSDALSESGNISNAEPNIKNSTLSESSLATEQLLSTWRQQVKTDKLAQHTTWRRLLYFYDDKNSVLGKKKTESLVDDPSFFLSKNGQRDSGAELDAMLVALAQELASSATDNDQAKTNTNNNSVLCRFPARVEWLTEVLAIDAASLSVDCPELDEWMSTLAPEQLSIMFAQEYLDNPLSAFAHTLLRFDSKASIDDPKHIDMADAVDYKVDGDPNDSFPIYATKSMIGSYNSAIEIDP
jgi:hypothetical protein